MNREAVLDTVTILGSFVGMMYLLVSGGATTIIVGKGVEFVGLGIIGVLLALRYPDEVHAIARTGSYLPEGHVQRYEVTYVPGSSRTGTRDLGFIAAGFGIALIALGVVNGSSSWAWHIASGVFFIASMLMSARHPIKRLLLVTWSVSQLAFILVFGGVFMFVFGIAGAAFVIVGVHAVMGVLLALPRTERMLERAEEIHMSSTDP